MSNNNDSNNRRYRPAESLDALSEQLLPQTPEEPVEQVQDVEVQQEDVSAVDSTVQEGVAADEVAQDEDPSLISQIGRGVAQGAANAINDLGDVAELAGNLPIIPDFEIPDIELYSDKELGAVGRVTASLTNYATVFMPVAGWVNASVKAAKLGSAAAKAAPFVSGVIADFVAFDKDDGQVFQTLNDLEAGDSFIPDFLVIEDDDSALEAKIKQSFEGLVLGGVGSAVGKAISSTIKQGKNFKTLMKAAKAEGLTGPEALRKAATALNDPEAIKKASRLVIDGATKKIVDPVDILAADKEAIKVSKPGLVSEVDSVFKSGDDLATKLNKIADVPSSEKASAKELLRSMEIALDSPEAQRAAAQFTEKADLNALAKSIAKQYDLDPKRLLETTTSFAQDLKDVPRMMAEIQFKTAVVSKKINSLAKEYVAKAVKTEADDVKLIEAFNTFDELLAPYQAAKSSLGAGLRVLRNNPTTDTLLTDKRLLSRMMAAKGNREGLQRVAELLSKVDDETVAAKMLSLMGKKTKLTGAVIQNLWRRSLLSGVGTHVWNLASTGLNMYYRSFLGAIGAVPRALMTRVGLGKKIPFSEYTKVVRNEIAAMGAYHQHMSDAFKAAWKVFKNPNADPVLLGSRAFRDKGLDPFDPKMWDLNNPDGVFAKILKITGYTSSLVSDRVLGAGDEFFKQATARGKAYADLLDYARDRGITDPHEIKAYANKQLSNFFEDGGGFKNYDDVAKAAEDAASRLGLRDAARHDFIKKQLSDSVDQSTFEAIKQGASSRALEASYQSPLGDIGQGFQNLVEAVPGARFVFPFIRTPINLVKQGTMNHLPGLGAVWSRQRRRLLAAGGDPVAESQIIGEQIIGTMMATTAAGLASSGVMTGNGPSDYSERRAWLAAGNRPYSFIFKDENGLITDTIDYRRLDPFNSMFSLVADLHEASLYLEDTDSELEDMMNVATFAAGINVGSKLYLRNISSFIDAALSNRPDKFKYLAQNYQRSAFPRLLAGLNLDGDQVLREADNWKQRFLIDVPFARQSLRPKYNGLGEALTMGEVFDGLGFFPAKKTTKAADIVQSEFYKIGYSPAPMAAKYRVAEQAKDLVDLRKLKNDSGKTALQFYNEELSSIKLGGKTLRQALTKLIKSKAYQSLSIENEPWRQRDVASARAERIEKIVSRYRSRAKRAMLKEFPQLIEERRRVKEKYSLQRRGMSPEEADKKQESKGLRKLKEDLN